MNRNITVSVVSHGHGAMVIDLCNQLLGYPEIAKVVLTLNIEESVEIPGDERFLVIHNHVPKGFAANHNAAFKQCNTQLFVVLNPDVVLTPFVFRDLLQGMIISKAKLIAPIVMSANNQLEDSVRRFPTFFNLLMKALGKDISTYAVQPDKSYFYPEWVAGMFMMFDTKSFASVNGFDEAFYLYYEDVDICVRFWTMQYKIAVNQNTYIVHNAQRDSRKKLRFMTWHLNSLIRYFYKHLFRLPKTASN